MDEEARLKAEIVRLERRVDRLIGRRYRWLWFWYFAGMAAVAGMLVYFLTR